VIRQAIFVVDLILSLVSLVVHIQNVQSSTGELTTVATFQGQQHRPTGIAISSDGRMFVNFPLWSDEHDASVVEVMSDGTTRPYPNSEWNAWREGSDAVSPRQAFVCVQSVWVDDQDSLWVLDPAAPRMESVVEGGAKLVKINLKSNNVERVYHFNSDIAPQRSYLNDVRVDTKRNYAYITDSGLGAIIALNLQNGEARRLLENHPSTKAESGVEITVQGKQLKDQQGQTPKINSDGIALTTDGSTLYYHALTGKTLYQIPTEKLRDESITSDDLAKAVEKVAETVVCDGLLVDDQNNVYHTAVEQNAIVRLTPEKQLETVAKSDQISWPDSMAFGRNNAESGELYFTTSKLQNMSRFSGGKAEQEPTYQLLRVKLPQAQAQAAAH